MAADVELPSSGDLLTTASLSHSQHQINLLIIVKLLWKIPDFVAEQNSKRIILSLSKAMLCKLIPYNDTNSHFVTSNEPRTDLQCGAFERSITRAVKQTCQGRHMRVILISC